MRLKQKNHSITSLFSFLLLLTFCLFALLLVGMGSAVYLNGTEHLNENYTSRTAIAYVSEKVRQHDRSGDIFVTEVEEFPAIAFCETVEGAPFITYVYFYDGVLCELFVRSDVTPLADMGSRLVELEEFTFAEVDGVDAVLPADGARLIEATAVSREGNRLSILIPIRSEQG